MTQKKSPHVEPIVIKKYANRRLYNTDTSTYVTLEDLCDMVKAGSEFIVYDAKSGEDLTRQILTQIIFEQESRGQNLLPIGFLRSLIGFYDDSIRDVLPHYLDSSMQSFMGNQEKMREYLGGMSNLGGLNSVNPFASQMEELSKQNMEMFTRAFSMFNPFVAGTDTTKKK